MTRALLLAALLALPGCRAAWAATWDTYYEVERVNDTEAQVLVCYHARPEAVMVCADPREVFAVACALRRDGGS